MTANDAYGQSEATMMRTLAPKYGIEVIAQETFSVTDTNFNAQLVRIRSANPDFVFSGATARPAILLFQQYRQLGLPYPIALSHEGIRNSPEKTKDLPAINGPFSYTPENHIGQDARGLRITTLKSGKFIEANTLSKP